MCIRDRSLAERLMAALNNTPLVEESAPQAQVQTSAIPLGALAPALKQQVPSLTYGAHNYSSDPAKRAVVLNGREWREGNEIAPGVILAAIAQDYIVLQMCIRDRPWTGHPAAILPAPPACSPG